jgi:hypothetical protein
VPLRVNPSISEMTYKLCLLSGAALLGVAMWLWVQRVAIPHQITEAARTGMPRGNLSDLYPRWLGARELLLHGRDPYSAEITREAQIGYYGRPIDPNRSNDPKDQQAFAYPLYVVFVLAPTVSLPFSELQHGFLVLLVLLTICSVEMWFRALNWRISPTARLLWIVLTLGCFPAIQGFKLQQLTLLVAGLMAVSMGLLAGRNFFLSGVLLAFASIKPQLVILPAGWLCLWTLGQWRERQKFIWGFGITLSALTIGAEFLVPGWISEFRRASGQYWAYTGGGRSVLDVLAQATGLMAAAGRVVSAALVCILLYWAWKLRMAVAGSLEFGWLLAVTLAVTLAVIPMFAPYNQVLLVPALMVTARRNTALWKAGRWARFLLGLTLFSLAWPWFASAMLVVGLLVLPASLVQKEWVLPLLTNFWIPTLTLGLLLVCGKTMRNPKRSDDYSELESSRAAACERP